MLSLLAILPNFSCQTISLIWGLSGIVFGFIMLYSFHKTLRNTVNQDSESLLTKIINDTLKKDGKFSRTDLTMFSSFVLGNIYAFWSLYKFGFDIWVFVTYMSLAVGMKVMDVWKTVKEGSILKKGGK